MSAWARKKMWLGLLLSCLAVFGLLWSAWAQGNPLSQWLSTALYPGEKAARYPGEGAGSGSGEPRLPPIVNRKSEIIVIQGGIKYNVIVNKTTLRLGEALRVDVNLTNTGSEVVVLSRSYPGFRVMVYSRHVDPEISETLRSLVWSSDYGKVYPMVVIQVQLKPGDSMSETFEWNLKDNDGVLVAPGEYYLYAAAPESPVMGPIMISVTFD